MTAISDPSGDLSAAWPWWVWAVLAAAALITLAARALANAPEQEPELSWLDQADGIEHCTVATCHASPTLNVHAGRDYYPFCEEHGMPHLTKGLAR